MERMRNKDLENAWAVQGIRQEKCAKLEEENKKLKELKCIPTNLEKAIRIDKENEILEEENQKLKEENKILKELIKGATEQIEELKEKLNKAGLEEYGFFNEY